MTRCEGQASGLYRHYNSSWYLELLPSPSYLRLQTIQIYKSQPRRRAISNLYTLTAMSAGDIFLGLLAIIFPPIAVWVKSGLCSCDSLVNILLCMLGYLPGLIHAWYIISLYPERDHDYEPIDDAERGNQVYIVHSSRQSGRTGVNGGAAAGRGGGYGTQGQSGQQQPTPPRVPNDSRPAQQFPGTGGGEGSASGPPPTYTEAVRTGIVGDHKVQTED